MATPGILFSTFDKVTSVIPSSWTSSRGEGVSVAVIDTGRPDHVDLKKSLVASWPADDPFDHDGHGTHIAGIIAARGTMTGVSPMCRLYTAKAIPCHDWAQIGRAVDWCVACRVDIINMSFGTDAQPPDETISKFEKAYQSGVFMCAGVGNVREKGKNTIDWPAKLPQVVPVAACGPDATEAPFSATGSELERGFSMPGRDIPSTWTGQRYAKLSGTSMASPFVAGIAALVISKHNKSLGSTPIPESGPDRVKAVIDHLTHLCERVGDPFEFGHGYLDASRL